MGLWVFGGGCEGVFLELRDGEYGFGEGFGGRG